MGASAIFYPLRLFQFLAQFKFFNQVRIFINILYRMTPGILVYTVFVTLLIVSWAQGLFVIFSTLISGYDSFPSAVYSMAQGLLPISAGFQKFADDNYDISSLSVAGLFINYMGVILIIVLISISGQLFKLAHSFERDSQVRTPDEEVMFKELRQIREQVN